MTNKLLTAKHWQLFLLTVAVPFVIFIISLFFIISMAVRADRTHTDPDFTSLIIVSVIAGIAGLISMVTHLSWVWSVSIGLQQYMHPDMRQLKVNRFRLFFVIPLVFMAIAPIGIVTIVTMHTGVVFLLLLLFMLGHFFTIFCIVYTMYFTAKTLRSVEMQQEAHFSDYIGEFFLIYFFPVGIWFIQPRINAIVNGEMQLPRKVTVAEPPIDERLDF